MRLNHRLLPKLGVIIGLLLLSLNISRVFLVQAQTRSQPESTHDSSRPLASTPTGFTPEVSGAIQYDTLPSLSNAIGSAPTSATRSVQNLPRVALPGRVPSANTAPLIAPFAPQQEPSSPAAAMPSTGFNFDGLDNVDVVIPADPNGAIGARHYVQWVNTSFAVWALDRTTFTPTLVYGPAPGNTLWAGLGGPCEETNDGDPIILYDHLANRWVGSQMAHPNFSVGPTYECIAISQTDDPTGGWYRYAFKLSDLKTHDYPKLSVWPDGYYLTGNQFNSEETWAGAIAVVFERDRMLAGEAARMIKFDLFTVNRNYGGMLPANLTGPLPPAGTPNYFVEVDDKDWWATPSGQDQLSIWEFHTDWATPANSTFGMNGDPNVVIPTDPFDPDLCGYARECIPQPGGTPVDAISTNVMNLLQYRNFGSYQAMVVNHTVDVDGTDHAGIRWYELRNTGTFTIYQQGTHAPDAAHRWMGSMAMDKLGNIALGYSVSSATISPSIRYAGRFITDTLGALAQTEASIIEGTGYQTASQARWGDYSSMSLDPVDDCTFWYTQEYYATVDPFAWRTRIASFKFPSCQSSQGTLSGNVTQTTGGGAIAGATVQATRSLTQTFSATTGASGRYTLTLPAGTYTLTVSAYGYQPAQVTNLSVVTSTTRNVSLNTATNFVVSGTIRDAATNWPLYARLDIAGAPSGPIYNDPVTGFYSVTLAGGSNYIVRASAWTAGYSVGSQTLTALAANQTLNFAMASAATACAAPGYVFSALYEKFEGGTLPAGWSTVDNTSEGDWAFDNPAERSNRTGGTGGMAILDSDYFGPGLFQDAALQTPSRDFSGAAEVWLTFDTDFNAYIDAFDQDPGDLNEVADVDISTDGGASWTTVYQLSAVDVGDFRGHVALDISPVAAGQSNVMARFYYYNASWELWWQIDNVGLGTCTTPTGGGLIVGNAYDVHIGQPLAGVGVQNAAGYAATTTATDDPAVADSFYTLFSPSGSRVFTASLPSYANNVVTVTVPLSNTARQDFNLSAGFLSYTYPPSGLAVSVTLGLSQTRPLTLTNSGALAGSFYVGEIPSHVGLPATSSATADEANEVTGQFSPLRLGETNRNFPAPTTASPAPRASSPLAATPWKDIADYPIPIQDNSAGFYNGKLYSVGGYDGFSIVSSGYIYDPTDDTWSEMRNMANAREKPAVAFINGRLYVVGGWGLDGTPVTSLEIYYPNSNTWLTGASIPTAYAASASAVLNGQFYVIGGCGSSFCGTSDAYRYNPTLDAWTAIAPYPIATSWLACGAIDDQLYCAGGASDFGESRRTYVYDAYFDTWTRVADMPQTQWGMGYTTANGLFLISGGVTNNFATITSDGFYYDPLADAWSALAASNSVLYRGASACGFYRVGGSSGGFGSSTRGEVYPGLTDCLANVDVPWLTVSPITGTLSSSAARRLTLTFNSNVLDQPGQYLARLHVGEDTPYNLIRVPVTFTVNPPATWGKVSGTITAFDYCDSNATPLNNATVALQGKAGYNRVLSADANGAYSYWLDRANGPLTITVSYGGYVTNTVMNVGVTAAQTTTQNVAVRLATPCLSVGPLALNATTLQGIPAQQSIFITNTGPTGFQYNVLELAGAPAAGGGKQPPSFYIASPQSPAWFMGQALPGGAVHAARAQCAEDPERFYVFAGLNDASRLSKKAWRFDATTNTWTALAPLPQGIESAAAACYAGKIYVAGGDGSNQLFIYNIAANSWASGPSLPRIAAGAAIGAWNGKLFLAGGDTDLTTGGTAGQVDVFDITANAWLTATPAMTMPVPAVSAGYAQAGQYLYVVGGHGDLSPFENITATQRYDMAGDTWETGPTFTSGRADFALAVTERALYAIGGDANHNNLLDPSGMVERMDWTTWPDSAWREVADSLPNSYAANNTGFCTNSASGGEVWTVGGFDGGFQISGASWLRSTSGEKCFSIYGDTSWLSVSSASGSVPVGTGFTLTVMFDSATLADGIYNSALVVATNDRSLSVLRFPVTLTVDPAIRTLALSTPSAALVARQGTSITYTLRLTNTGNVADTYDLSAEGNRWGLSIPRSVGPLDPNSTATVTVQVDVPVDAPEGAMDTLTLNFVSQTSAKPAGAMVLNTTAGQTAVSLRPMLDIRTGDPGATVTHTIQLTNTGNLTDSFDLTVTGSVWGVSPLTATVGPLAPGGMTTVDFVVAVPMTTTGASSNGMIITADSQNGNASSAVALVTIANNVFGAQAALEANALIGAAGETVTYTLFVTNTGNAPDRFDLTISGTTWSTTSPLSVGPLAAGASAIVSVGVQIPLVVSNGTINTATLVLTSRGNTARTATTTATTTVSGSTYRLYLPAIQN